MDLGSVGWSDASLNNAAGLTGPEGEIMKESKYSFLYQAHDGSIMRPESFLNINKGRTLSSSQLRVLGISKIKNPRFRRQASSNKRQASSSLTAGGPGDIG